MENGKRRVRREKMDVKASNRNKHMYEEREP